MKRIIQFGGLWILLIMTAPGCGAVPPAVDPTLAWPETFTPLPPTATMTITASPTATDTPLPTATPSATPTPPPPELRLTFLRMSDGLTGWGWDGRRVVYTEDGWAHWRNLSPEAGRDISQPAFQFFALNRDLAWLVSDDPGRSDRFAVRRTENAGKDWSTFYGYLPKSATNVDWLRPVSITFSDSRHGWARLFLHTGPGETGYYGVYKTDDSGKHWFDMHLRVDSDDEATGVCDGKLYFDAKNQGWMTKDLGCTVREGDVLEEDTVAHFVKDPVILLRRSINGGLKWEDLELAAPTDIVQALNQTAKQGFIQQRVIGVSGYGPASLGFQVAFTLSDSSLSDTQAAYDPEPYAHYLYLTFDSGASWKILSMKKEAFGFDIPMPNSPEAAASMFFFLDSAQGWFRAETDGEAGALMRTTDGGKTWSRVSDGLPPGPLGFRFLDENLGWALGEGIVRSTIDGGETWETLTILDTEAVPGDMATPTLPSPTGTGSSTPAAITIVPPQNSGAISLLTPGALLAGGNFAKYWRAYRDADEAYGFAYPADWVGQSQPDLHGAAKWMKFCNTDEPDSPADPNLVICVEVMETPGIDPAWDLRDAARAYWCPESGTLNTVCGPMTLIPAYGAQPERVDFSSTLSTGEVSWVVRTSSYRTLSGVMLSFLSVERHMQTPEVKALVDSFVTGDTAEITAPDFQPAAALK